MFWEAEFQARRATGEASAGGSAAAEPDPSRHCPRCGTLLEPRSCKLLCERCGYTMSCSDFL